MTMTMGMMTMMIMGDDDNGDDDNGDDDNGDDDDDDAGDDADDSSCALTTAVVGQVGLGDDSEPLKMARYLRDCEMTDRSGQQKVSLYYKISPLIVARATKQDWQDLWENCIRPVTILVKNKEYELAEDLYTLSTVKLLLQRATRYSDTNVVNQTFDYGLRRIGTIPLPYTLRYLSLKIGLFTFWACQSMRYKWIKRRHKRMLIV